MAAATTPYPYTYWKFFVGANQLEGLLSATQRFGQALHDTVNATPTKYRNLCLGVRDFGWQLSGGWNEGVLAECGIGATLSWDGGSTDHKGLIDARINVDVTMMPLTSQSSAGQREIRPGQISTSLDFTAWYYDPVSTGANWSVFETQVRAGTGTLTMWLDFGTGSVVKFDAKAESLEITRAHDAHVQISGTAQANTTVTDGTAGATGLAALMTACFGQTAVTAKSTSSVTGNTEWLNATTYVSNASISCPVEGPITYDITLEGSGAITYQTTPI